MKTIIIITTIAFSFLLSALNCFSQSWIWAKSGGGSLDEYTFYSNSIDKNTGSTYVTGTFYSFYSVFDTVTIYRNGNNDIFYGKYNTNGNVQWMKRAGGNNSSGTEEWAKILYDSTTNSVYLYGAFYDTMILDTIQLVSSGLVDIFLAKIDVNGNVIWAKKAGGSSNDSPNEICLDNSGNIYLTGSISSSNAMFNGFPVNKGGIFAKYDNNGNCVWAKTISQWETYSEYYLVNSTYFYNNNIYLIGEGYDTTAIDTSVITDATGKIILSCFNTDGNILSIKLCGGGSVDFLRSDIDNLGNIYFSGVYSDSAKFGSYTINHAASSSYDVFITKYDLSGNCYWVRNFNVDNIAINYDISADNIGNVYITGYFVGTANFGNYAVTADNNDMYVTRYSTNGDCLGVRHFGRAWGGSVGTDINGSCIVTGFYMFTVTLDTFPLVSSGVRDFYIAKHAVFTGVEDEKRMPITNNTLLIYANPNTGKCNITVPDDFLNEPNLTLSIFDNSGKIIQQKTLEMTDGKIKLNIENEAKGMYNAVLSNGNKNYSGKIIFE